MQQQNADSDTKFWPQLDRKDDLEMTSFSPSSRSNLDNVFQEQFRG